MRDKVVKALGFNNEALIYVASVKEIMNEMRKNINFYPSALDALGRLFTIGEIFGIMLKENGKVTVKVDGDGPIGMMVVVALSDGRIKGYVENPECHFEYNDNRLDVQDTVGRIGEINVTKDLGLKQPFTGNTPIISGEIGDDFAYYFAKSEQIPSVVSVGTLVNETGDAKVCGGFVIQLLPNASEETILAIEKKVKELEKTTILFQTKNSCEDIIKDIDPQALVLASNSPSLFCECSKERYRNALKLLSTDELSSMNDGKEVETICQFCGKKYTFSSEEINDIIKEKQAS